MAKQHYGKGMEKKVATKVRSLGRDVKKGMDRTGAGIIKGSRTAGRDVKRAGRTVGRDVERAGKKVGRTVQRGGKRIETATRHTVTRTRSRLHARRGAGAK
jgi:predicted small secreted protein